MATYNLKVYLSNGEEVDNIFAIPEISATGEAGTYVTASSCEYGFSENEDDIPNDWVTNWNAQTGWYTWTRVGFTLSDGTNKYVYSRAYQATNGQPGNPGTDGTWIEDISFVEV